MHTLLLFNKSEITMPFTLDNLGLIKYYSLNLFFTWEKLRAFGGLLCLPFPDISTLIILFPRNLYQNIINLLTHFLIIL